MEKKFYNEDFEQFLRESVESFQMFPSRKVWYGIYNDLHPSKKWPSLAITLLLVSAVLFLGISNNNSINRDTQKNRQHYCVLNTKTLKTIIAAR